MSSNEDWEPVIGLEIHIELATKSKMFCRCSADHFGKKPNAQACPVCLGLPGSLPYPNKKAIEWTVLAGLALNCEIPLFSKFDRKNYFYPDLPKGYQISQYDLPFAVNGRAEIKSADSKTREVRIRRVHLEEDTAKLIHDQIGGEEVTLIDFNRAGVPLMELVTEPDLTSPQEAKLFLKKLQQIIRYLEISDGSMEKGSMRCEPNISLRPKGSRGLPDYKVEVKNLNSFRFVQKALEYEIKRQWHFLQRKEKPAQETRGWDEVKQRTYSQRRKEQAHDYRYFPEPDIPPFRWSQKEIVRIRSLLPELPVQKIARWCQDFNLVENNATLLAREKNKADYFEEAVRLGKKLGIEPKEIANVVINKRKDISRLSPSQLVGKMADQRKIQKLDRAGTTAVCVKVLEENPDEVRRYREGKTGLLQFFVGRVMSESQGAADPNLVNEILKENLDTSGAVDSSNIKRD